MNKIKTKGIGVLKEREYKTYNAEPGGLNMITTTTAASTTASRQLPAKVSSIELTGILDCRRRLEWTKEWLKKNQHEFLNKENLRKEFLFRSNEIYHLNCFFNISEKQFRYLVNILEPLVTVLEPQRKKKTFSAEERIAITLKYLATGEVNSCRNYCFRASKPVIVKMIADICQKMYELLKDQYLGFPKNEEQSLDIINGMQKSHHVSNCLGYVIMRQISFYTPPNQPARSRTSQLDDDNDKSCAQKPRLVFSTIVDGQNNFLYVNVEQTQAQFYDEIYQVSKIRRLIEAGLLAAPKAVPTLVATQVENCDMTNDMSNATFNFLGSMYLPEKPYSRLTSQLPARVIQMENSHRCFSDTINNEINDTLCILCNIFPVLSQPLRLCEKDAQNIILGSVALYNYLRKTDSDYCKLTNNIIKHDVGDSGFNNREMGEDDDCILIYNEEEQQEREEFTPNVFLSSCFRLLPKQRSNTVIASDGLANSDNIPK